VAPYKDDLRFPSDFLLKLAFLSVAAHSYERDTDPHKQLYTNMRLVRD